MIQIVVPINKHSITNKIQAQNWPDCFLDSTPINPEGVDSQSNLCIIK